MMDPSEDVENLNQGVEAVELNDASDSCGAEKDTTASDMLRCLKSSSNKVVCLFQRYKQLKLL